MATNSDTDSDPETEGVLAECPPSSSRFFLRGSRHHTEVDVLSVDQAVDKLLNLSIAAVRQDVILHDTIGKASDVIIGFLSRDVYVEEGDCTQLANFAALLRPLFLSKLFEYRTVFHEIASEALAPGTFASVIVCWVDVILAKLGDAIITFAGGSSGLAHDKAGLSQLIKQREDDNLRTAAQLPRQWYAIAGVIPCERSSPAAKRLALQLMFAAYVIWPRLSGSETWCDERIKPSNLIVNLTARLTQLVFQSQHVSGYRRIDAFNPSSQDRLSYCMLISLFVVTDCHENRQNPDRLMPPYRPRSLASILCLIDQVMFPDGDHTSSDFPFPLERPDPAQEILLHWGEIIPWCWKTWEDCRTPQTDLLTISWLYHLGNLELTSLHQSCNIWASYFESQLVKDVSSAAKAMLQLLHSILSVLSSSQPSPLPSPLVNVLFKICWATIRLTPSLGQQEFITLLKLPASLISVFVLLGHSDSELDVKDLIVENLCLLSHHILSSALKAVLENDRFCFKVTLDEIIARIYRSLQHFDTENCMHDIIHETKLILDFTAIICYSGAVQCLLPESVSSFFSSIARLLYSCPAVFIVLCDSFLNALAALGPHRRNSTFHQLQKWYEPGAICQIAVKCRRPNLMITDAIAAFANSVLLLSAEQMRIDTLALAEAWDHLRDSFLLVLTHQFLGDREPLALLVSPVICQALGHIMQSAHVNTVQFILSSPWTMNLCAELRHLLTEETLVVSEYLVTLRRRIIDHGRALLDQIAIQLHTRGNPDVGSVKFPPLQLRLISYRLEGISRLLLAPE